MAEHLRHKSHEALPHNKELDRLREEVHKKAHEQAKSARHEHAEKIDEIREKAEKSAVSEEAIKQNIEKHHQKDDDQPLIVNQELKSMAYQRTLRRTQSQLSAPSRAFSKVIHAPAVEAVSEVAGKTVARPSGVLVGGIFAFIGSSAFLWIARHYGYEYNFLLFALLFVAGFFVGLLIELGFRLLRRNKEA